MLVSTGEQKTIALLAMAIQGLGHPARSFTGAQMGMRTDTRPHPGAHREHRRQRIHAVLDADAVAVIAGFQGVDDEGNITTLGRGGSDTSAVAVAAALGADVCEIYTDVDGVFTTDPRMVPAARKLDRISYEEMIEMASLGAKVLQIRSVRFAMRYGVPLHVRSSFKPDEGTWVVPEEEVMEGLFVSGVTYNRDEAKIRVRGVKDVPGRRGAHLRAALRGGHRGRHDHPEPLPGRRHRRHLHGPEGRLPPRHGARRAGRRAGSAPRRSTATRRSPRSRSSGSA